MYNSYFKTSLEELSKDDIKDLFEKLNINGISYTDTHIIIPWGNIINWRIKVYSRNKQTYVVLKFAVYNMPMELTLHLSLAYKDDDSYIAFKKYAASKENPVYKKNYVLEFIIIIAYILITLILVLKNK